MTGLKIVQWLAQGHAWSCILFIVWITNGKWRRTNEIMLSFTWRLPIKKMMIPKSTYVPVCNIRNLRKIHIQHLLKQELFFFKLRHSARYPCFTQRQLWVTHSGVVLSRDDTEKKVHIHTDQLCPYWKIPVKTVCSRETVTFPSFFVLYCLIPGAQNECTLF